MSTTKFEVITTYLGSKDIPPVALDFNLFHYKDNYLRAYKAALKYYQESAISTAEHAVSINKAWSIVLREHYEDDSVKDIRNIIITSFEDGVTRRDNKDVPAAKIFR